MRKLFLLFILQSISVFTQAQDSQTQANIFTLQSFYDQLMLGHPLIKQANLLSDMAKQEIRLARGGFDPKITSNFEEKSFKNVEYFRTWKTEIKAPTITGLEVKAGYESNRGEFLSPDLTVPATGLAYAGVGIPIAQGLLFDARRAALREAQYAKDIFEAERVKLINKAILQATKDYWGWYLAFHQLRVNQKGYNLAQIRYEGIVDRVIQGDAAAIDSVEAKITVQMREITLRESEVILNNARLTLSNHLWDAEGNAVELLPQIAPTQNLHEFDAKRSLEELLDNAKKNHPEIVKLDAKLKQLLVGRRLAIEMLKPVINLNYNFLGQSPFFNNDNTGAFFQNNYKYGVDFSFPIFLRKERAKLQQTNIKLTQTQFERTQTSREILNEVQAFYNDVRNFERLLTLQETMVNNYQILLNGEQERFLNGESSLFLVNSRESSLLSAELKFIELQFKYAKTKAELLWAAGLRANE